MSHGGRREGAGRRAGGVNAKRREIVEKAIGEGITPVELMLHNMRFYHQEAGEALAKLIACGVPAMPAAEGDESGPHADVIEAIKNVLCLRDKAQACAKEAAPYVHPRQGYVGDEANPADEEIPLAERLKEYQRRDDLKAAGGNVVDLTR